MISAAWHTQDTFLRYSIQCAVNSGRCGTM